MNFGQNIYNWFLSNAQSLVLLAIVVIGLDLGFKREFSKLKMCIRDSRYSWNNPRYTAQSQAGTAAAQRNIRYGRYSQSVSKA